MLKSYEELRKIDVKPFCKKRDGNLYLPWATCMSLLHDYGAEKVYWDVIPNETTGNSLRCSDAVFTDKNGVSNRAYETRIKVVIDDNEYEYQTAVLNGNNPVKDNSMTQLRVWNSMCRAFVKCVAIHTGLGFDLWVDEENKTTDFSIPTALEKPASKKKIELVKSLCASHGLDSERWVVQNGKTWETLTEAEVSLMLNALKERYGDE